MKKRKGTPTDGVEARVDRLREVEVANDLERATLPARLPCRDVLVEELGAGCACESEARGYQTA